MNEHELEPCITHYLEVCERQRRLNSKTVRAYRTDLRQLTDSLGKQPLGRETLAAYIAGLNRDCKPRTFKRKLASVKAFCRWMEDEGYLTEDPFRRFRVRLREPKTLPRTIPLRTIEDMLRRAHSLAEAGAGDDRARRDSAVLELLFATGIRVSELCGLNAEDVNLKEGSLMIWGKGAKERLLQIGNVDVLTALRRYAYIGKRTGREPFFVGRDGQRLTDQSVRRMVHKYGKLSAPTMNVTPHMFRHSFATLLLEEDVDIRYIQRMLGHSSILTTQIYTNVAASKQKDILSTRHPRNRIAL